VWVTVNLRGGSEYGDAWHEAGMKEKQQNVFDDFIAAAEWLVAKLFKVALPAVGVMDMLRFHKFTIGWNWIADYGSADDPAGFAYLIKYSPLHNLKDGVRYPATLVTTADHDDRVVPAHSFKFAASLQQAHRGPNPVLIRIETSSGHGSSSLTKALEVTADEYAFTLANVGRTPRFTPIVP
jgi:prolyl oligopeptidase